MLHLTNENFDKETKSGNVVVDFWAEWCGPCKMLGPIFEATEGEMTEYKFAKVNVDEQGELAEKFGVRGIPTIVFLKDGEQVGMHVGMAQKEQLKAKIEEAFK